MRSEHKTTQDEFDAFTGWRHVLVSMQRAGVRKALKRRSHRQDRRRARQDVAQQLNGGIR
jgi:hypothetical protein